MSIMTTTEDLFARVAMLEQLCADALWYINRDGRGKGWDRRCSIRNRLEEASASRKEGRMAECKHEKCIDPNCPDALRCDKCGKRLCEFIAARERRIKGHYNLGADSGGTGKICVECRNERSSS